MSRLIRAFSFSPEVCERVDQLVEHARRDPDLAQRLGLAPPSKSVLQLNNRGLTPADYDELRRVSGIDADGDILIEQMMKDNVLRPVCISVVSKAQRRNYKARDTQIKTTSIVNASRVVAAVLLKGIDTIQATIPTEKKASENAATKSTSRKSRNAGKAA